MAEFAEIEAAYRQFPERVQSLMLSTVTPEGWPQASYAPFVLKQNGREGLRSASGDRCFYIFVSGLSNHTANLNHTPRAGILLIQDEAETQQIFARQRLMYDCEALLIERHDPNWGGLADYFQTRFGNLVTMLRQLPDFQIFQLTPKSGRFVVGFGAAYAVDPTNCDRLIPLE